MCEEDTIQVGNKQNLAFFFTPGHTRCSVSYYLTQNGILFPGDALGVVEKNGNIRPLFLSDYSAYIKSILLLSQLTVKTLALPHNTAIKGEDQKKPSQINILAMIRAVKNSIQS